MPKRKILQSNVYISVAEDLSEPGATGQGLCDRPIHERRTVNLNGWVSTHNIRQLLQLLQVGDGIVAEHPTTARNLISISVQPGLPVKLAGYGHEGKAEVLRLA